MPQPTGLSPRTLIRDGAEAALKAARRPLHNSEIAELVLPQLGLSQSVSSKDVNTALHDDPCARFVRVGRGTWTLKAPGG